MLLREGEIINKVQLLKLKSLQAQTNKEHMLAISIGAAMIMLCLLIFTYILHINHNSRFARNHNKNLIAMACMLITVLLFARVSVPLSEALTQNSTFAISSSSIIFGIPIASGIHDYMFVAWPRYSNTFCNGDCCMYGSNFSK